MHAHSDEWVERASCLVDTNGPLLGHPRWQGLPPALVPRHSMPQVRGGGAPQSLLGASFSSTGSRVRGIATHRRQPLCQRQQTARSSAAHGKGAATRDCVSGGEKQRIPIPALPVFVSVSPHLHSDLRCLCVVGPLAGHPGTQQGTWVTFGCAISCRLAGLRAQPFQWSRKGSVVETTITMTGAGARRGVQSPRALPPVLLSLGVALVLLFCSLSAARVHAYRAVLGVDSDGDGVPDRYACEGQRPVGRLHGSEQRKLRTVPVSETL
jgi:hypothetical protein